MMFDGGMRGEGKKYTNFYFLLSTDNVNITVKQKHSHVQKEEKNG